MENNNKTMVINKRKKSGGFTLVELLATIAILSLVSVIVMYTATNVINNAREKSYLVTINNIQKESGTYVLENDRNINWLSDDNVSLYQCVTVQNLIDMGYFDNDILDSKVSEDRNVLASDYIYIEKDNTTKTITKQVLLYDGNSDLGKLCGDYKNADGNIVININPPNEVWAQEKDITITYKLDNKVSVGDSDNYKYSYGYSSKCDDGDGDDNCAKSFGFTTLRIASKKITVYDEGTVLADIKTQDNVPVGESKNIYVDKIDTIGPKITENASDQTVRGSVTIPIIITDTESGVNVNSISLSDFKVSIGGNDEDIEVTLSNVSSGKHNLKIENYNYAGELVIEIDEGMIEDKVGNGNKETILNTGVVFDNTYKITYHANVGSGSMQKTTCTYGSSCQLRKNTFDRTGYTFLGWSTDENVNDIKYVDQYIYNPFNLKKDIILYAIWKVNKVYINYKVNGGTLKDGTGDSIVFSVNTDGYVLQDNVKMFNSISYGGKLDTSGLKNYDYEENFKISKLGYHGKSGEEWKCLSGCITSEKTYRDVCSSGSTDCQYAASDFCDASNGDCTVVLGVNWEANTYKIKYNINSGTSGTMADTSCTYGFDCTFRTNQFKKTGYIFNGWNTKPDGSGTSYADKAKVKNLTSTNGGSITLYAIWKRNDTTSPTCTISATAGDTKVTASCNDDSGSCAYYGWSSSYSGTNATNKTIDTIGTITYYVKDAAGNKGSCSATISSTTKGCEFSGYSYNSTYDLCYAYKSPSYQYACDWNCCMSNGSACNGTIIRNYSYGACSNNPCSYGGSLVGSASTSKYTCGNWYDNGGGTCYLPSNKFTYSCAADETKLSDSYCFK